MRPTIFKRRMSFAPMRVTSQNASGFTLIELMIVIGLVAIFMAAVFSLYQTHQRSAYTQEETAEVQQNLRVGMDMMMDDIRMTGFLVPSGTNPINFNAVDNNGGLVGTDTDLAGNPIGTDTLTLFTASPSGIAARVTSTTTQDFNPIALGQAVNLSVSGIEVLAVGAQYRIVVAQTGVLSMTNTFTVTAVNSSGTCGTEAAPCATLTADAAGTGSISLGNMIVRSPGGPFPHSVIYSMVTGGICPANQNCLQRNADDGTGNQIIASNITGLQFMYVLQNGTEVAAPTDLTQVRGVRVTITGRRANTTTFTGGVAQPRTLVSVAGFRN